MLQVEHRILLGRVLVIFRRSIDDTSAPFFADIRVVPALADQPVRYVLDGIVVHTFLRDFNTAYPFAHTEERFAIGIGGTYSVYYNLIVVEAYYFRFF